MPTHTHDQIAQLAYRLWMERGCPQGSPEVDWQRARQMLDAQQPERLETPPQPVNEVLKVPSPTIAQGSSASRRRRKGQPTHLS